MARPFSELRKNVAPERRQRNRAKGARILKALPLFELRAARSMSQEQLARTLNVQQAAISRMERRSDVYISTLRRYIEAMGGKLVIRALFPDGEVEIDQFHEIGDNPAETDDDSV